jgi:transketolase
MNNIERMANHVRQNSLKMVHRARASHIGSALSITDILCVLYGSVMRYNISNAKDKYRDRFILSKGHSCVALYSVLAEIGFISFDDLNTYGEDFSWLMNHISHHVKGVEFSTGSLGHGLPFGVGKALSAKVTNQTWRTFVLLSDGEMDEGSNWEALMFASHHMLNKLTIIIDYNKLQSLTTTNNTLTLEPLFDKLNSFGLQVYEIDGHDLKEIFKVLTDISNTKPKAIIAHTIKGKGVSFMENNVEWHYKNPSNDQLSLALYELSLNYA